MFFSWGLNQKEAWDHPPQFTFPNRWFDLGSTLPCRSPDPPSPSERREFGQSRVFLFSECSLGETFPINRGLLLELGFLLVLVETDTKRKNAVLGSPT